MKKLQFQLHISLDLSKRRPKGATSTSIVVFIATSRETFLDTLAAIAASARCGARVRAPSIVRNPSFVRRSKDPDIHPAGRGRRHVGRRGQKKNKETHDGVTTGRWMEKNTHHSGKRRIISRAHIVSQECSGSPVSEPFGDQKHPNKKLLGTKGITTRSKKLLVAPGHTTSSKKLLGGGHR